MSVATQNLMSNNATRALFAPTPDRETFVKLAAQGNMVPVWRDILADMETPVSAFRRLAHRPNAFLLESVEGGERMGRYSFLGSDPRIILRTKGRMVSITENGETRTETLAVGQDALHVLENLLKPIQYVTVPGLPRFVGGAVGYIGYDWVRFLEPIGERTKDDLGLDDVHLLIADTLVIFDHVQHRLRVLANARVDSVEEAPAAYDAAVERINELIGVLRSPLVFSEPTETSTIPEATGVQTLPVPVQQEGPRAEADSSGFVSNMTREEYRKMILAGKEYITAGDVIQVVLSQRFSRPLQSQPFDVYRALRSLNPSPYMFYLAYQDGPTLVGASPEILVTQEAGKVVVRPIAGTRRRGINPEEDAALEKELLADQKECAEHIMLVDLGRNDIGRVCEYGSVKVDELMVVEKYSHVMHIVSNVSGKLRGDKTAFDLLRATFPAGTLSGAPKVRAMQIIEELEPTRRGVYGGAIGYFSYNGNLDACITIRTALIEDGTVYVQSGGGIVADSDPDAEFEETMTKSGAVKRAVEMAETGLL
jgi:anthranilate synthase component 1